MSELGTPVPGWTPRAWPEREAFEGRTVRMEPTVSGHAADLFEAFSADDRIWDYLPYGPYYELAGLEDWLLTTTQGQDPQFYSFIDLKTGKALGVASLMRITPDHGVIEVGHINMSVALQRTVMATEGLYLLMRHCMEDLGYRRFEWKCNALNEGSKRAAMRFGFTYEGTFRQANVFKGRSRDTAWFSFLDSEWPQIRKGFEAWLSPDNFDAGGQQRRPLQQCRHEA